MVFYWSCFAISFLFLLWVLLFEERTSIFQCITTILVIIANGGWIINAGATTAREAAIGIKLTYVGGIFIPVTLFFTVCEICRIYIKRWAICLMLILQVLLYMTVCTIGHTDIFYKSLEIERVGEMIVPVKEYGPMHSVYLASLFGYYGACIVTSILSMNRKNAVSFSNCMIILIGNAIGVITYTTERILKVNFDVMPLAFVLLSILVYTAMHKIHKYDVSNNSAIVKQMVNTSVYIAFDEDQGYESCNDHALTVFPELKTAPLEKKLSEESAVMKLFGKNLAKFILSVENRTSAGEVEYMDHIYNCSFFRQGRLPIRKAIVLEMNDVTEEKRYVHMLKNYNKDLSTEVENKTRKINEMKDRTLLGMAMMVESRDSSTGGHIKRTSDVVNIFAKHLINEKMGFSAKFLRYVERSAPMHDLGKIAVDDAILRKQGRFTDQEYEIMKTHAAEGAKVVKNILTGIEDEEFVKIATNVAHYHHEKVNGKGYPEGLSGDEIPVEARIMALADVFDALVSKRCYKEAFSFDKAFNIIKEDSGTHFDADLARVFLECRPELEALYAGYEE